MSLPTQLFPHIPSRNLRLRPPDVIRLDSVAAIVERPGTVGEGYPPDVPGRSLNFLNGRATFPGIKPVSRMWPSRLSTTCWCCRETSSRFPSPCSN